MYPIPWLCPTLIPSPGSFLTNSTLTSYAEPMLICLLVLESSVFFPVSEPLLLKIFLSRSPILLNTGLIQGSLNHLFSYAAFNDKPPHHPASHTFLHVPVYLSIALVWVPKVKDHVSNLSSSSRLGTVFGTDLGA